MKKQATIDFFSNKIEQGTRKALVIQFIFSKNQLIAKKKKKCKQTTKCEIQIIPNSYEYAECLCQACKGPDIPCLSLK